MRIDLDEEQVDTLQSLIDSTLRELSYEIASADVPTYRKMLRARREVLRSILEALRASNPAVQQSPG